MCGVLTPPIGNVSVAIFLHLPESVALAEAYDVRGAVLDLKLGGLVTRQSLAKDLPGTEIDIFWQRRKRSE